MHCFVNILFGCLTEESNIKRIGFMGIDDGGLRGGKCGWNLIRLVFILDLKSV
jgi:hypothetical protein